MIDIHCHILPDLDDGPRDSTEALQMADLAAKDGITGIVATPHAYPDFYFPEADAVARAAAGFQARLKEAGNDIQIWLGSDAHLVPEFVDLLRSGTIRTLNNSRYVLTEPSEYFLRDDLQNQLFRIRTAGYVPILTHPERYPTFVRNPDLAEALAGQENYFQVTAGSLLGRFGEDAQAFCRRLASRGLLHFIASDAHGAGHRTPALAKAYKVLEEWVGPENVRIMKDNALAVVENRNLAPFARAPVPKGLFHRLKKRFRRPPGP
jgi:protein-tyrosine phosphatase